jgi:hypothetical protein
MGRSDGVVLAKTGMVGCGETEQIFLVSKEGFGEARCDYADGGGGCSKRCEL